MRSIKYPTRTSYCISREHKEQLRSVFLFFFVYVKKRSKEKGAGPPVKKGLGCHSGLSSVGEQGGIQLPSMKRSVIPHAALNCLRDK